MNPALLLDTHAWIWWLLGPAGGSRLSAVETAALDALPPDHRPALADFSLWEVATKVALGKLQLDLSFARWIDLACRAVQVLPLTAPIAVELARLPAWFHRDPADRAIVATARVHGLALLTHDRLITASGLVPLWTPPAPSA